MVRKINDHGFWAGGKGKAGPFPDGSKVKEMREGEGCGDLNEYRDSAESIKRIQDKNKRLVEKQKQPIDRRY